MEQEFVYWRHPTIPGIKIEEVSEGGEFAGKLWMEMARQLYCENGRDAYREIGHFQNGAPFLYGETGRISISHCAGLFVVATLPSTPEVDLSEYSDRAALGVDAERANREQVLRIREKFLSPSELAEIPADDVEMNVLAWTVKEAAYKAAFGEGVDLANHISIRKMPRLAPAVPVFDAQEYGLPAGSKLPDSFYGEVEVYEKDTRTFTAYSYRSDACIVTLCYSPKCAKFGKA